MKYEYRVIPAPAKGLKAKGIKTQEERFAHSIEQTINEMAKDDWEYLRAEALPAEERSGLTSKVTKFHNLLVFRRAIEPVADTAVQPEEDDSVLYEEPKEEIAAAPPHGDEASTSPDPDGAEKADGTKTADQRVPPSVKRAFDSHSDGQMMGILRTIKGQPIPSKPSGDA